MIATALALFALSQSPTATLPVTYEARVTRVVDGDTFDCEVVLPFDVIRSVRVRCDGYDAPERFTPRGPAATKELADLLSSGAVRITAPSAWTLGRAACRVYADCRGGEGVPVAGVMKSLGYDGPHGAN